MSGHSKWATTKRQKEIVDGKRGKIFTKIAKLITVAARDKGGDITTNFSLRMAVDKARSVNMPKENIERAIKRGTGADGGAAIESLVYEAIGPAKSQFIIKCLSDSKNRTASEIRHLLSKNGGALSAVMWNFQELGVIRVSQENLTGKNFDDLELELIDAGVEDIQKEEEGTTILTKISDLQKIKTILDEKNIIAETAQIEFVPKEVANLNDEDAQKVQHFIDLLDDNEDVDEYFTNINL